MVIRDTVDMVERMMNTISQSNRIEGCMLDVVAVMILLLDMCRLRIFMLVIFCPSNQSLTSVIWLEQLTSFQPVDA